MSQTKIYIGKLKKVDLQDMSLKTWAEEYFRLENKGLDADEDPIQAFTEEYQGEAFYIINGNLYEILEHREIDSSDDIYEFHENPDGTIDYVTSFYNGSTCLSESLKRGIELVLSEK